jgi:hypothetical protein
MTAAPRCRPRARAAWGRSAGAKTSRRYLPSSAIGAAETAIAASESRANPVDPAAPAGLGEPPLTVAKGERSTLSEPTPALEEGQKDEKGDHLGADADTDERLPAADATH